MNVSWCCKLTYLFEKPNVTSKFQIQQALLELLGRKKERALFFKVQKTGIDAKGKFFCFTV